MADGVQWLLNAAGRHPLLTHEEELLLGRTVQEWLEVRDIEEKTAAQKRLCRRGERAYTRMFNGNIRLVINVAKRFTYAVTHLSYEDLIQEGCIGLSRAIEKYDPARGYKFSTYAYWWIRQGISRAIDHTDNMIRLQGQSATHVRKLRSFIPEFYRNEGRLPSIKEMQEHCGCKTAESMEAAFQHIGGMTSLDHRTNTSEGDASTILELLACDRETPWEVALEEDSKDLVAELLPKATPQQAHIISCRWGLTDGAEQSFRSIGECIQINRDRVRLEYASGLETIRRFAVARGAA